MRQRHRTRPIINVFKTEQEATNAGGDGMATTAVFFYLLNLKIATSSFAKKAYVYGVLCAGHFSV